MSGNYLITIPNLNKILFLFTLFIFSVSSKDPSARPKEVVQKGNLVCIGDIYAKSLTIGMNKDFYAADAEMTNVETSEILTNRLKSKELLTSIILANNNLNTLTINSFLKIKGEIKYESKDNNADGSAPQKTSFLQLSHKNMFLNNVKQWKLLGEFPLEDVNETFNDLIANKIAGEINNGGEVDFPGELEMKKDLILSSKTVSSVQHVLIEANFKFVNFLWNNNTAYIKIGEELFWLDHHNWEQMSQTDNNSITSYCDSETWNTPIRIVLPISGNKSLPKNTITLTFGIKLQKDLDYQKFKKCPEILTALGKHKGIEFDNLHISIK